MKRYLNLKTVYGVETVDELELKDFKNRSSFNKELKRLKGEYHLAGMSVYSSQRAASNWR